MSPASGNMAGRHSVSGLSAILISFLKKLYFCNGEMAEWSNAAVLKTVVRLRGPGVRIPLSPQLTQNPRFARVFLFAKCARQACLSGCAAQIKMPTKKVLS
jgi:hypothetical protein